MNLKTQRKISSRIMKVGLDRVKFDSAKLAEIKEAITRADITSLISRGIIKAKPITSISRARIRKTITQKRKGRRRGKGSKRGKRTSRLSKKRTWMNHIRLQRDLLKTLRDNGRITKDVYRDLYNKAKGGLFRSKRHLKLYLESDKIVRGGKNAGKAQENKGRSN